VYEIIIIVCLAVIFAILLSKWPKTAPALGRQEMHSESKLSDIDFLSEGERLFKEKKYREAEKYYVKAVARDSENPLIYGRLGIIYTKLENFQDAKEALKMAVKLDPDNGFYQNNLGMVLYSLGRFKESSLYFENAVKIDDKIAKRWLNLGLAYQKIGERKKAEDAIKKALNLEPDNEDIKNLLASLRES